MNSLNLRVSSIKTGDNVKKNAEMRTSLVALPKHFRESSEEYCLELKKAKTVPDQVSAVKNVFKTLCNDTKALQFLADLYFYCPLKHPVRNQILKLLITAARLGTGTIDVTSIVSALSDSMQRLVEETKSEVESCKWNIAISSLTGCFENFESGLEAMEESVLIVFPFLCASLQKYLTELGVLSSPSVRNEYYLYIHNSIRLLLSCMQEFSSKLVESNSEQLKQLNSICRQIILDDEIPMDPRTNSGILLAQNAKLFDEYETYIQEVKLTKNPNEIALCVGIINTFDHHDFQQMSADIRDICSKIDEFANSNANVPNILLCATRALYQISKILLGLEMKISAAVDNEKLILRKLLIFSFGYLEHHMDSVRHLCRDLLRNIITIAKKLDFEFLLQKIFDACNSERLSMSMKCIVLQQATLVLGAEEIIKNCTEIFKGLFSVYLGRDFIVNNLFEVLMATSHKELDFIEWFKLWIVYLLEIALANDARLADIELLIVKSVKYEPKVVQRIIEMDSGVPISTKLSALWAVRKSGIQMDNFDQVMQTFSKDLLLSILSNCDDTRIMALRLLVETHKTTELLTDLECEHILTYVEYNANCQSPATRQKTLALLSKALNRCELNLIKVLKDYKSGERNATQFRQLIFLRDLMYKLVANIFPGANFSRRTISLQLLQQCVRICINCNLNIDDMIPMNTVAALVEVLADSYESNKELSVNILKLIEDSNDCRLIKQLNINITLPHIQELLISVRPTDSVTATYQLEFYCNRAESSDFGNYDVTSYHPTYFAALRWLLVELKKSLKVAKQSILQAAKLNPLYGILFAQKHLLKQLDFQSLSQEISWRILIAELVMICKELTTVVGPVVNSSSPEGHLPNDFSELPAEYAAAEKELNAVANTDATSSTSPTKSIRNCKILSLKNCGKLNMADVKTTPQMVLLCAWRTVKEVSLILGEIVLRSPLQLGKLVDQFLLTKEQILEIGEHFKQLLSETKHRGAFEQAYVGYSKLCCRLWRTEVLDLNSLPMLWLRELISIISKDEQINEKICATRRSAGVPFMVQALITSELQVGTTKSLYYCMSHLFQLCAAAERSSESRTHALNILRALFRCTDLNESIGEFVSEGVMCAIRGYDADSWSEKNSATLLFAALITRIFGVQRTKDSDNLNIRNKMTGRVFFLRYPKLYDFFLEQLQGASALIKCQQKANKLHPLLLILSRLYPSALDGTESNLKLTQFIPYISDCAGCPEMQTRYLAAKAIAALITKDVVSLTILRKCAHIVNLYLDGEQKKINLNILHGQLLQILLILKSSKDITEELISDISCTIVSFHEKTQIKNAVILKAFLDIFIVIFHSLKRLNFPQEIVQSLLYFSTMKELYDADMSRTYPVFRKTYFMYNIHILRLTLPFGALSDFILNPPLTHASVQFEHAETCLNIIMLTIMCPNINPNVIDEFEITATELQFISSVPPDILQNLAVELRQSKTLQNTLKELARQSIHYPENAMKAYAILSLLDNFDFTLSQLLRESRKHPGDFKSSIAMCMERLALNYGIDYKTSQLCLQYLTEIAQPWYPDGLRFRAARILTYVAMYYPKALEKKKLTFVQLYIALMLSLLMDEDYDVRDHTAKIVINSIPEDIEMTNMVSTMAQRLFLQYTADMLLSMRADDKYILDVFKVIVDTQKAASAGSDDDTDSSSGGACGGNSIGRRPNNAASELEIFDRNEANVFAEPLKVILDSIVVFRNTFSERKKVCNFVNDFKA